MKRGIKALRRRYTADEERSIDFTTRLYRVALTPMKLTMRESANDIAEGKFLMQRTKQTVIGAESTKPNQIGGKEKATNHRIRQHNHFSNDEPLRAVADEPHRRDNEHYCPKRHPHDGKTCRPAQGLAEVGGGGEIVELDLRNPQNRLELGRVGEKSRLVPVKACIQIVATSTIHFPDWATITGELYYINWRTGMRATEDPRTAAAAEYVDDCSSEEDDSSSYDSDGSSLESSPCSSREQWSGKSNQENCYYDDEERNTNNSNSNNSNNVLVVAGCKSCLMYYMVPKQLEICPKCCGQLLHFDRSENASS
ncbi:hypothetical protein SASPL_119019 [Salvia splendens]|uniref:Uncharacterized protein n=1 Tax=Salvia splendens TaxID=180675 RepID=A0A8X8ZXS5_SALSN|nr:hypothetical protein SASPL_119019 [Salvia splendens]